MFRRLLPNNARKGPGRTKRSRSEEALLYSNLLAGLLSTEYPLTESWRETSMDKRKLVFDSLLVFILGAAPLVAFGQAAAEAGLLSNMSATSTSSAASSLSATTNRALQGQSHKMSTTTVSHTATTTAAHRTQPTSKVSAASTKNGHSAVATTTGNGAKLPNGIAHVWPEGALTQSPAPPQ